MSYTTHGHHIPGTILDKRPEKVMRCGGVGLCDKCSNESARYLEAKARFEAAQAIGVSLILPVPITYEEEIPMADLDKTPKPSRYAHAGPFMTIAMEHVYSFVKERLDKTDKVEFGLGDVYIVWFTKTLQNWKALVSTALPDGKYYEVTYNGDKDELYIDGYVKFQNVVIKMGEQGD